MEYTKNYKLKIVIWLLFLVVFHFVSGDKVIDEVPNNDFYERNFECPSSNWTLRFGKCYMFVNEQRSWNDAEYYCTQNWGHLVSVHDASTNVFLSRLVSLKNKSVQKVWLGLSDHNRENTFVWSDNSESIKYEFYWMPNEPKNLPPGEDCVEKFVSQYFWNDVPCTNKIPFVCQTNACVLGSVKCDNGKCISKQQKCDGVNDCGDNSDEKGCGRCKKYLNGTSGNIKSPNYPDEYNAMAQCSWYIEVPHGYVVELNFTDFFVEEKFDFVVVYDGFSFSSVLKRLTGMNITIPTLASTSNKMLVHFQTDESKVFKGFEANFKAVKKGCGEQKLTVNTTQIQTIQSQGYPNNYLNDVTCIWDIENNDKVNMLTIQIVDMDTEVGKDVIEIRNGGKDGHLLGIFSGIVIPGPVFSSGPKMWLKFQSDLQKNGRGFRGIIQAGCRANLFSFGIVSSPGFGYENYPSQLNCTWRINATTGRQISFVFHEFDTESKYDVVTISTGNGRKLKEFSGSRTEGNSGEWVLHTNESVLVVTMVTDIDFSMAGFNATFSVGCKNLPSITNGSVSGSYHYGGMVTFACNDGYMLVNGSRQTCEFGGVWSKPKPYCKKIDCGNPGVVKNGGFNGYPLKSTEYPLNTTIRIFCNPGYKLNGGSEKRICQQNGKWSGEQPKCEVVACPTVGIPVNGRKIGDFISIGANVTFQCNEGFKIKGKTYIICGGDGEWSSPPPSCEAIVCNAPRQPENGVIDYVNKTYYGKQLNITCGKGYHVIGQKTIKCVEQGIWEPKNYACLDENECVTQSPCKGEGTVCVNMKGSFRCECKNGYEKVDALTCKDINECNSTVRRCGDTCTNFAGGFKCSCLDGYFLYNGNKSLLLDGELKWALKDRSCFGHLCPEFPTPPNGYAIGGRRYPSKLTYGCKKGWVLDHLKVPQCQKNGTWSQTFPSCIQSGCSAPENVSNAVKSINGKKNSVSRYNTTTIVTYNCITGFRWKAGNLLRECIRNSQMYKWSGKLPVCSKIPCGVPVSPKNGKAQSNGTEVNDTVSYTCNDGFKMIGNSTTAICQLNGKWSGMIPVCAPDPCPDPGVPHYGTRSGKHLVGESVIYNCSRQGYSLIGNLQRTCFYMKNESKAVWSGKLPVCKDVSPPKLNCSKSLVLNLTLPRFESKMLVEWPVPYLVEDNSGEQLDIFRPSVMPPVYLSVGSHTFTYSATDRAGNNGSCTVNVIVKDTEKPRVRCPPNLVINSSLDTVVTWNDGMFWDNVGVQSVAFNPANGSIFRSNERHRVEATITDVSGNRETCVMEIDVQGCGCSNQSICHFKPDGGLSTCHINQMDGNLNVSCSLSCFGNESFVDPNFSENGNRKSIHCNPQSGWTQIPIPGCAARKQPISCSNVTLTTTFNGNLNESNPNVTSAAENFMENVSNYFSNLCEHITGVEINDVSYKLSQNTLQTVYKLTLLKNATVYGPYIEQCIALIRDALVNSSRLMNMTSSVGFSFGTMATNFSIGAESHCCKNVDRICCPPGHVMNTTRQGAFVCLACSLGMYLNRTMNKCTSCPVGTYTPTSGYEQCLPCQNGSTTLGTQSTSCLKYCTPGSYSSTGTEPACRKCDYGEYQNSTGQMACMKCEKNTTTSERGSISASQCQLPCPPGQFSKDGFAPCRNCTIGYYQDQTQRTVCKKCVKEGEFGIEGATSVDGCPPIISCGNNTCRNNGICLPNNYSTYVCQCPSGFTGRHCEVENHVCLSSPCGRNGNCSSLLNGTYQCNCNQGFSGQNCEVNIDECANVTCENFGFCQDMVNSSQCLCVKGFTGKRCETKIDECSSNPCSNNGTCISGIGSFKCQCTQGFEGERCENETNECISNPCFNNGTCIDQLRNFTCDCQSGFEGKLCAVDIDECVSQPCLNNGTCIDAVNGYKCVCKDGFTDRNCSTNINECRNYSPCLNNATCRDDGHSFTCNCSTGFHGDRCEVETNFCEINPCQRNGTCISELDGYQCICPFGFYGNNCENETNECAPNPCQNNATCHDLIGNYNCTCEAGYVGRNCSHVIDNCASNPCFNDGNCTNQVDDYTCHCVNGYEGRNCQHNVNECASHPCTNNAYNCTDLLNDYFCFCTNGYRGKNCSEKYDFCDPNPCLHQSNCSNDFVNGTFICDCTHGYYGNQCENKNNECILIGGGSPCQNGGSCIYSIGNYSCKCPSGFSGSNCEVNINDCVNVTCFNGGSCYDKPNDYECKCPVTHFGSHCEKRIPDEVDIDFMGGNQSFIAYGNITSPTPRFTLSVWVRYRDSSQGTFLSLFDSDGSSILSINENSVWLTEKNISIASTVKQKSVTITTNAVQKNALFSSSINDSLWHHVVVIYSEHSIQVIHNEKVILNETVLRAGNRTQFFHEKGRIVIGNRPDSGTDTFAGQITRLGIWDDKELSEIMNCNVNLTGSMIPWVGLMDQAGKDVRLLRRSTCTKIDKNPPNSTFCPSSKKVIAPQYTLRVFWKEPKFIDDIGVTSVVGSHTPGQVFEWGDHVITYVAKDAFNNTAICTFDLYISGHNCSDLAYPNNSLANDEGEWKWGRIVDYKCLPNYKIVIPKPPYFSCGKDNKWSHGPPIYPENADNLLPMCMKTMLPTTYVTNTLIYNVTSCDVNFEAAFRQDFIKLINKLNKLFGICGRECNYDTLHINCTSEPNNNSTQPQKMLYQLEEDMTNYYQLQATLTVQGNSTSQQSLMKILKANRTRFNQMNGTVTLIQASVGTPKLVCKPGYVLQSNTCAPCQPGYFEKDGVCKMCRKGSFSSTSGAINCTACQPGNSTLYMGSKAKEQCFQPCNAGYFLEKRSKCVKCPYGTFNNMTLTERCTECPRGYSTQTEGAQQVGQCDYSCRLGMELVSRKCSFCLKGYYRNETGMVECVRCPNDLTTYAVGNRDGHCKVLCPAGSEVSSDGINCQECEVGYYKQDERALKCNQCNKLMTRRMGAIAVSECINITTGMLFNVNITFIESWNKRLSDRASSEFRSMAKLVINAVWTVYKNTSKLYLVKVIKFTPGSIVAELKLNYEKSNISDPTQLLRDAVSTGFLGGLKVDAGKTEFNGCAYFRCKDKKKKCVYEDFIRKCVCVDGYYLKGNKCEKSVAKEGNNVGLVVGLSLGSVVVLIVLAACVLKYKQKQEGNIPKPMTDEIDVSGHPMDEIESTKIDSPIKASNCYTDTDDMDNKSEKTLIVSSTEEKGKDKTLETHSAEEIGQVNEGADIEDDTTNAGDITHF